MQLLAICAERDTVEITSTFLPDRFNSAAVGGTIGGFVAGVLVGVAISAMCIVILHRWKGNRHVYNDEIYFSILITGASETTDTNVAIVTNECYSTSPVPLPSHVHHQQDMELTQNQDYVKSANTIPMKENESYVTTTSQNREEEYDYVVL